MLNTHVPLGVAASVTLPVPAKHTVSSVLETGHPVWNEGHFVPGVAGVLSGTATADGGVVFEVVSGSYTFVVTFK